MNFLKTVMALGFVLAASSVQAATVTLFDDDFAVDSAGIVGFTTVTSLNKWNVTQGNVDVLGTGFSCSGCIDLDGSFSQAPAKLETKDALTFMAGVIYTFQLFFSTGTEGEVVTIAVDGGGVDLVASGLAEILTYDEAPLFDVTDTFKISLGGPVNNFGPYLDRVLITYQTSAIPLPAGAPLLLAGIGALGWLRRRKGA